MCQERERDVYQHFLMISPLTEVIVKAGWQMAVSLDIKDRAWY